MSHGGRRANAAPALPAATRVAILAALIAALAGCATAHDPAAADAAIVADIEHGLPKIHFGVLGSIIHAGDPWTHGLEIADGVLYESVGQAGHSRLREVDFASRQVLREASLPSSLTAIGGQLSGTGISATGPRIWQLTQNRVAIEWDRPRLRPIRTVPMTATGRGLCRLPDGQLVASDGGDQLRLLSPRDLAQLGVLAVRVGQRPLTGLGELACVPGAVWATVDRTKWLVRIDPTSGAVTGAIDTTGLAPSLPGQQQQGGEISGLAAIPDGSGFLVTGPRWPNILYITLAE